MSANNSTTTEMEAAPALVDDVPSTKDIFLNRARSYPLVQSTRSAIYSIPCTTQVKNAIKPTLKIIRSTEPIKTIMDNGDLIGIYSLDQLDRIFPTLKTLEAHDLTDPVTRPFRSTSTFVNHCIEGTNQNFQSVVVQPTNKAMNDLRTSLFSVIYDANGKGVISSRADPIFKPINNQLETAISRYLHDIKTVPEEGSTSEMSRTWRILLNAMMGVHQVAEVSVQPEVGSVVPEQSTEGIAIV
ncbi:hypothetical protein CLIB1423_05S05754 [[Candida] railenensis]|uniref:Uncharacterized protein n=1 Tax=[Candida] railenensis TaxID=45579 RepID=A0A9P0QMQ5_9ASCO|nr:hypothetical protein CLIB1423_05S05754 [[Candida] railenensis]